MFSVFGTRKSRPLRSGIDASKPVSLKHVTPAPAKSGGWSGRHGWMSVTVAAVSAFGMAAAIAISPQYAPPSIQTETVVQEVAGELQPEELVAEEHVYWREERVLRSDSVATVLSRMGITDKAFVDFIKKDPIARTRFTLDPGKTLSARTNDAGGVIAFYLPLQGDAVLMIEKDTGGSFRTEERRLSLEPKLVMKSGEIHTSLFAALDAAGLPDGIATQLSDIFASQIDFHNDLKKGDKFTVVFESFYHQGRPVRSGRILAAEFINDGQSHRALYFADTSGKGTYYTPQGKNLKQSFLRSPLEFSRVTSGFSGSRMHPVLGYSRAHTGVDYGAPTGTPVRATADGTVDFIGRQSGYGNIVIVNHAGKLTTYYAHLSSFASNLSKGSKVSQGDEIGKVGSTGLATGPHLHYEVRIGDVPQNPMAVAAVSNPQLSGPQLGSFRDRTSPLLSKLDLLRNTNIGRIE